MVSQARFAEWITEPTYFDTSFVFVAVEWSWALEYFWIWNNNYQIWIVMIFLSELSQWILKSEWTDSFRWRDHSLHPIIGSFCPWSDCCSLCITFIHLLSPSSNEYQWFTAKGWHFSMSLRSDMVGSETTLLKQSCNCFS